MQGIESIARFADGSYVAVGTAMVNGPLQGYVVKLTASGDIDESFGSGGTVLLPMHYLHAVTLDSQQRIVVGGEHFDSGAFVYTSTIVRLDGTGAYDPTFGSAGVKSIAWTDAAASGYVHDLAILDGDAILVGGGFEANGSGLGLFHARKTMEAMNGTISIDSKPGIGTKIKLGWPATAAPTWFVSELKVGNRQVVSIDDDDSIHLVWKERLKDVASSRDPIAISSPDHFLSWYREKQPLAHKTLFLVDYEFLNHSIKGLDLIEQLDIAASSILVTSQFEEPSVRARAEKLGVRILPKSLAQLIPLCFAE